MSLNEQEAKTGNLIQVLIVGAGPVGLAFASEMARYGISFRIIDKAEGTKQISKALILHARTQEVLDAMQVGPKPQQIGVPMRRLEMFAYGKHIGHQSMEGIDSPFTHPVILGQNVTEQILQEHLATMGRNVEWKVEAKHLAVSDDSVTVSVQHGDGTQEEIRAQYVLGADGTHSTVRGEAGINFTGSAYTGQAFIQSDSKIRWSLPSGVSYLWFTEEGYMMVIEMPDGLVRTFISVPDNDPTCKTTTLEEVNSSLNRLAGIDAELYDATWVALFRTNHRAASTFRKGRIFLAGDAAHEHVPIGGQGMNTSIQDAFNLGWKLAYVLKNHAKPALLDSYMTERHPVAESLLKTTDVAYTKIISAGDLTKAATRALAPSLLSIDSVRRSLRETIEEVNINYRDRGLSQDLGGSAGLHAGDRVLDVEVVQQPDKTTIALRHLLTGLKWSLLIFTGTENEASAEELSNALLAASEGSSDVLKTFVIRGGYAGIGQETVISLRDASLLSDATNRAHGKFGVSKPCLYLLRPDRYVGMRAPLSESHRLRTYLQKVF